MLEQQLKEIWKNSAEKEKIKFNLSQLMIELEGKMNKISKSIRRRDRREIGNAIMMIPVFGYLAYIVPFPLTKIGIILAMIGYGWYILKMRSNKQEKLPDGLTFSFRKQLENQKLEMVRQAKLSDTVLYWFLIPSIIPYTISILGLGDPTAYGWSNSIINQVLPMSLIYKLSLLSFAVIVFAAIYWANKHIVKKIFNPLIQDIEKIQQQLESLD